MRPSRFEWQAGRLVALDPMPERLEFSRQLGEIRREMARDGEKHSPFWRDPFVADPPKPEHHSTMTTYITHLLPDPEKH